MALNPCYTPPLKFALQAVGTAPVGPRTPSITIICLQGHTDGANHASFDGTPASDSAAATIAASAACLDFVCFLCLPRLSNALLTAATDWMCYATAGLCMSGNGRVTCLSHGVTGKAAFVLGCLGAGRPQQTSLPPPPPWRSGGGRRCSQACESAAVCCYMLQRMHVAQHFSHRQYSVATAFGRRYNCEKKRQNLSDRRTY